MRRFAILALAFTIPLAAFAQTQPPAPQPAPPQPAAPAGPTPEQLWSMLVDGNKSFIAGKISFDELKEERTAMRTHQAPPVTILACSDSRVPPELIFNQSLGALFVVRSAGNVADDFGIASVDFALLNGYTRLIVVLAHDDCGAVDAALSTGEPNTKGLIELIERIRSSFIGLPAGLDEPTMLRRATELNARASAAQLMAKSPVVRAAVAAKRVKIVAAYYDFATGEVKALAN